MSDMNEKYSMPSAGSQDNTSKRVLIAFAFGFFCCGVYLLVANYSTLAQQSNKLLGTEIPTETITEEYCLKTGYLGITFVTYKGERYAYCVTELEKI